MAPHDAQPLVLGVSLAVVGRLLDAHMSLATAPLDVARLSSAYASLEALGLQYVREAALALREAAVPTWHHKLLHAWCATQPAAADAVTPAALRGAQREVWAEVQLTERCGPRLADALSGAVAFQELLFPGGSMEAVLPVYEQAAMSAFYNACVVAAIEAVLSLLCGRRRVLALEVGAGAGGTASSVLPVLDGACERYVFTDVSEVFLRQARVRFACFGFVEYALLNIDADPRLQGFPLRGIRHNFWS